MSDQDKPRVNFERVEQVVCARHGEPFRARWPKGYVPFMLTILQHALENEELAKRLEGDLTRLPTECDRKPLCEWVDAKVLLGAYKLCDVGVQGKCALCGLPALGTPYRTHKANFKHVCFYCVLHRLKPMN